MFHRNQEGASALEFALVLPILVVLIFGAFSVGIAYNEKLSLSHGARDAARYAATLPLTYDDEDTLDISDAWFEAVRDRVVAASQKVARSDGADNSTICVAYIETLPSAAFSKIETYSWSTTQTKDSTTPCFPDDVPDNPDNSSNAHIQIRVVRDGEINIVMLPPMRPTMSSTSVVRFEPESASDNL